jgi:predicted porin
MIPAGDWTLDIGGVVNAYYTTTSYSGDNNGSTGPLGLGSGNQDTTNNITTGLLPNYLSVSGKTRQNDLDVGFTISINPGASTTRAGIQNQENVRGGSNQENRQAFLTFGDASWGSIKLGKDLGIYASDAILNDMTLLGVGSAAGNLAGNTTTLGRIGRGFMYADWKSQVAYTSPDFNGFNFTVGATQGWNALASTVTSSAGVTTSELGGVGSNERSGSSPAFEGKASYAWTGDVAGKVWASFISQKVEGLTNATVGAFDPLTGTFGTGTANTITSTSDRATAFDIGTTVNVAGLGLTAYYGQGDGIGQTGQLVGGFDANGRSRDSDQWYLQATYALPTATKVGVSYGESTLDGNSGETFNDVEDSMWVVGAYHPITKHLNLVAEYSVSERDVDNVAAADAKAKAKTISLGAILFF